MNPNQNATDDSRTYEDQILQILHEAFIWSWMLFSQKVEDECFLDISGVK